MPPAATHSKVRSSSNSRRIARKFVSTSETNCASTSPVLSGSKYLLKTVRCWAVIFDQPGESTWIAFSVLAMAVGMRLRTFGITTVSQSSNATSCRTGRTGAMARAYSSPLKSPRRSPTRSPYLLR